MDLIIILLETMKKLYTEMTEYNLEGVNMNTSTIQVYSYFISLCTDFLSWENAFCPAVNVILCHNLFEIKYVHFCLHCSLFLVEIPTALYTLSLFGSEAGFVDLASIICTSQSARP